VGNRMQLIKNVLAIRTDANVGIGRVERNSLIRIENNGPFAGLVLIAVEGVGRSKGAILHWASRTKGTSPLLSGMASWPMPRASDAM
jgi:hypothetical protein